MEEKMQDTMIRASNKARLTKEDLLEANKKNGLMGVYDLGMQHMYEYLKDTEEQGLLLRLPCKVGDTIYSIEYGKILEKNVNSFEIWGNHIWLKEKYNITIGRIGHTVFRTKEEAERKLQEMSVE